MDDEFYEELNKWKWYLDIGGYAVRRRSHGTKNGKRIRSFARIHREVMNAPKGVFVDHINGNRRDNRLENLRLATNQQNQKNSKVTARNKYGYKGVTIECDKRYASIWRMTTHSPTGRQIVFHFKTPQEAAREYDRLNVGWFGDYALTNAKLGLV